MRFVALLLSIFPVLGLHAASLRVFPDNIHLHGPHASQQVIVVLEDNGNFTAEITKEAQFSVAEKSIVTIDSGILTPGGEGKTTLTVSHGGKKVTIPVQVTGMKTPKAPDFIADVIPILTRTGCNSGACHGALAGKGGFKLSLRGYDPEADHFAITRQLRGRRTNTTEPEKSLLLLKGTRTIPHSGGTRIEEGDQFYQVILDWIRAGATADLAKTASVSPLTIYPPTMQLKPGLKTQVLVSAKDTTGSMQDVTRLAKFVSSNATTADVDEDGIVVIKGPGEASISALFGTSVASMTVTVPYGNQLDATVFDHFPERNFIDGHVLRKLKQLQIPPSATCDDATYIRRVFLDTMGVLPTMQEVNTFVASKEPNKREKLVDSLFQRTEFVDCWTYKWSDLLLVSTFQLPDPAMWAFSRHIRNAVEDNMPWDRFARETLLASGSTLQNGGGNYFVLHKDIAELTEKTAVTFMGMSITCARCHNHPLEKWTQDQYWGMANLFSRVGMKNGKSAGDVVLANAKSGDVLHPRLNMPIPPTPLDAPPMAVGSNEDRREYFVNWLTAKENPFFAPAVVNRVWKNFMGRGLVEADDDLRETNPPTNIPLMQELSAKFIEQKYDLRWLMRTILTSAAYQRQAEPLPENKEDDRYYSHYFIKRLSSEVLLDALSSVTAVPTPFNKVYSGVERGTAATSNYPLGTRALELPDARVASAFLDAFGRPERQLACSCERTDDSTVGQALLMNNSDILNSKLRDKKSRITTWLDSKKPANKAMDELFLLALARTPNEAERTRLLNLLGIANGNDLLNREALEDLFWAVLTSKEFMFNH
ncbi:MAG: DUF1553 domain-containing protein [Zavarzinella sp.]